MCADQSQTHYNILFFENQEAFGKFSDDTNDFSRKKSAPSKVRKILFCSELLSLLSVIFFYLPVSANSRSVAETLLFSDSLFSFATASMSLILFSWFTFVAPGS